MFSDEELEKRIAMVDIPAEHSNALLLTVDKAGVGVAVVLQKDDNWKVRAYLQQNWNGYVDFGTELKASW